MLSYALTTCSPFLAVFRSHSESFLFNTHFSSVFYFSHPSSPLFQTVEVRAEKTSRRSVKPTVKIAHDLWDSVLSEMILTRLECCLEMWQLRTHIGCVSPYLWQLARGVTMTPLGLCLDQLFSEGAPNLPHNWKLSPWSYQSTRMTAEPPCHLETVGPRQ